LIRHDDPADGSRIDARAGEPFEIVLRENPTTGYVWHVAPGDRVRMVGDAQFELGGSGIGAGGTRTFRLVATEPGESPLTFTLQRPKATSVAESRTLTVSSS
jgi:predicted secreted protein